MLLLLVVKFGLEEAAIMCTIAVLWGIAFSDKL